MTIEYTQIYNSILLIYENYPYVILKDYAYLYKSHNLNYS